MARPATAQTSRRFSTVSPPQGADLLAQGERSLQDLAAEAHPTLLAAIGHVAHPSWRASAGGVYRLWRDLGYAAGALLAGVTADLRGIQAAILAVAALTFVSGVVVVAHMRETLVGAQTSRQHAGALQPAP